MSIGINKNDQFTEDDVYDNIQETLRLKARIRDLEKELERLKKTSSQRLEGESHTIKGESVIDRKIEACKDTLVRILFDE